MQKSPIITQLSFAAVSTIVTFALVLAAFFAFEPTAIRAQTNEFTVTQQIQQEIAFVTNANDVTLDPPLPGLTSGTSQGSTTVAVSTNSPGGYNMTIEFAEEVAMQQENGTSTILNYDPLAGSTNADYAFTIPTGTHGFAYSVFSETAAGDSATKFLNDGTSACGTGSSSTLGVCWYNQADARVAETIVDRSSPTTGGGATTTISFQVGIDANPSPALPTGFYTATATLTITAQ